jgi:hypothetical protein
MARWADIDYRDFWDVPRIFLVRDQGTLYLFDCQFDRAVEDYPESYDVFVMPPLSEAELAASWAPLHEHAIKRLGRLPIHGVQFDPTLRQRVDVSVIDGLNVDVVRASG